MKVLDSVRVLEIGGLGPGPFCAMHLADLGADVISVVRETKGRETTGALLNRGKRSVFADLKTEEGRQLVLALVAEADALIEGMRPGVMERLGLGPEECLAVNPRLVYGRMTGWGQQGPLAHQAGHDLNYLGLTGALHAIGAADRPPPVPLNYVADFGGGGMLLAFGMLAALLAVRGGAPGQVVDAAMVDGANLLASMFWGFRAGGGWSDRREGNLLDGGAYFYTTYACADGRFLAVACVERRFHDLLLERLRLDPDVYSHDRDPAQWPALRARLAALFATQPRDHWAALFEDSDACVTPILDWREAEAHRHAAARGAYVDVEGVTQPAPAPRLSVTPARAPAVAPAVGAHSVEVLREWGVAPERVASALGSGLIVQA